MLHDHLSDGSRFLGDMLSVGIVLGTISEMLPAVAAILTIVWTGIRIYETKTFQRLLGRGEQP